MRELYSHISVTVSHTTASKFVPRLKTLKAIKKAGGRNLCPRTALQHSETAKCSFTMHITGGERRTQDAHTRQNHISQAKLRLEPHFPPPLQAGLAVLHSPVPPLSHSAGMRGSVGPWALVGHVAQTPIGWGGERLQIISSTAAGRSNSLAISFLVWR